MSKFDKSEDAAPDRTGRRVQDVLKFKPTGSVEDARKAMIAAGEAPKGMVARPPVVAAAVPESGVVSTEVPVVPPVVASTVEEGFEDELEVPVAAAPAAAAAVAPVTPAPVVPAQPPKIERVENAQFVADIKQENGEWIAEIRYKSGAGTERFTAKSKNQLMLKLLEGKGHATLRVNKAVRREKLGFSELDREYPLPNGITTSDFEKMSDAQQDHLLLTIATQQGLAFREAHPEFYQTKGNAKKINDFLVKEKLPITQRNLEYALDELSDPNLPPDVRLEERPQAVVPPPAPIPSSAPAPAPARTDSAPAAPAPAAVPTAAAPAAPVVVVRKRGTTGLRPSDASTEVDAGRAPEDGREPRQLSEAELKKLPMSELKRIAYAERKQIAAQR